MASRYLRRCEDMVECFLSHGYKELDTAYVYNDGECERLLGEALKGISRDSYEISSEGKSSHFRKIGWGKQYYLR